LSGGKRQEEEKLIIGRDLHLLRHKGTMLYFTELEKESSFPRRDANEGGA